MLSRRDAFKLGTAGLFATAVGYRAETGNVSAQASVPDASLKWSFDHEGVTEDGGRMVVSRVGILLKSPQSLMLVDSTSLKPIWENQYEFPLDSIVVVPTHNDPVARALRVSLSDAMHIIDLQSGHAMLSMEYLAHADTFIYNDTLIVQRFSRLGTRTSAIMLSDGSDAWEAYGRAHLLDDKMAAWDEEPSSLTMHSLDTGNVLWTSVQFDVFWMSHFENWFVVCTTTDMTCFDAATGRQIWTMLLSSTVKFVTDRFGFLLFEDESSITCLDMRTGISIWQHQFSSFAQNSMEAPGYELQSIAYIELADDTHLVYSGTSGNIIFHSDRGISSEPSADYAAFTDGESIVIFERSSDTTRTSVVSDSGIDYMRIRENMLVYVTANSINVVDLVTNTTWTQERESTLEAVRVYGQFLFTAGLSGGIEVYRLKTGELVKAIEEPGIFPIFERPPLVYMHDGRTIVVFDSQSQNIRFERSDSSRYVTSFDDGLSIWAETDDDVAMVVMKALDADGNERWSYAPPEPLAYISTGLGPRLEDENNTVWVADSSFIYAMNGKTGEIRMRIPKPEQLWQDLTTIRPHGIMMFDGVKSVMYGE